MAPIKSQNSNMLLAFLTLLGVIAIVAVVGFFMLRKGPEIIQQYPEYVRSASVGDKFQSSGTRKMADGRLPERLQGEEITFLLLLS